MRLLVLSSNNGQGHNSAARALLESARRRDITAVMIDGMLFQSPRKSELYQRVHTESALHAPRLFETGTRLAEKMEESRRPSPEYRATARHTDRVARFIRDNGFDTVVATHIFSAQLLTNLDPSMRAHLTTAFVATDYSYTPFTSETALDAYFLPHRALVADYEKAAPGRNYIPTGIPTSEDRLRPVPREAARAALALPPELPIVLIMTGSMGYGDVAPLVSALLSQAPADTLILVLCGNNRRLITTLGKLFPTESRVRALAYTDQVGLYLDAADVLLSKPGGLSSTEAAVKEIPLVHSTPLPGWEEDNVRFFTTLGLSRTGDGPEALSRAAVALLTDADAAGEMRARQRREINKHAARDILDALQALNRTRAAQQPASPAFS